MEYKDLIRKAKKGDTSAFTELYKTVYRKLYQHAFYTLNNAADAEDVVSETVLDAFDSIKNLKKEEAFDVWIFRILQAKCNRKLREICNSRNTIDFEAYVEANMPTDVDELASDLLSSVERIDLRAALSDLDSIDREIINLHVILGYTSAEIAAILDLNENTIRSRESRALKKLRAKVKEVI